jgi:hypothetical protein
MSGSWVISPRRLSTVRVCYALRVGLLAASEYAGNFGVSIDKEVSPKASLNVNLLAPEFF